MLGSWILYFRVLGNISAGICFSYAIFCSLSALLNTLFIVNFSCVKIIKQRSLQLERVNDIFIKASGMIQIQNRKNHKMQIQQQEEQLGYEHITHERKSIFGQKRPNTYKSYKQMLFISGMYYVSFVYFGYIMMYFNSIDFGHIMNVFQISMSRDTAQGIYSGLPSLGACLGSFISKYFIEKYSRNQNFVTCNVVAIFAGILVLVPNMNSLFVGRLTQGVCVGFFCSITPLTVKELSPIELAGTMNGVNNIAISLGYFIGYILGWMSSTWLPDANYNYLLPFGATFLISFIQLIWVKVIFPYETPKYLLLNGRVDQAKQIIDKIYLPEYQARVLEEKMMQVDFAKMEQKTTDQQQPASQPILDTKPEYKPTILAAFSASFLVVAQQMTGFNVFLLFGSQISKQYLPDIPISLSMIISLQKLIVTGLACFLLFNILGRKKLLVIGSTLCSLSLYSVVYGGYKIKYNEPGGQVYIFLGIFVCMFAVAATQGPLTWVYISEVLQPKAIPFIVFMKWITNFLSVATFPILRSLSDEKSCVQIFLAYFLFTMVATIIFQYILVETKDKNEVQIHQQIQKKQDCIEKFFCKCIWWRNQQYRINTHWNRE